MNRNELKKLLNDVSKGKLKINDALENLKFLPYEDLGFAKIDTHRSLRKGFPEVILSDGKTTEQTAKIAKRLLSRSAFVMITKAEREVYEAITKIDKSAVYYETAKIILVGRKIRVRSSKSILVASAGTSDIPIAEEAAVTAEIMGNAVERLYDIGVAGIHRLFKNKKKLFSANVIIVVAGMDGALSSVVTGLVDKPVIAVPTSTGYGASFNGLAALLTMLNCCAPGMTVVNIDNGFGGGYFASLIN